MQTQKINKRLTIFAGHYGSGKTTLSVRYALRLRETYDRVTVCDLDIVNPYFRTLDGADVLRSAGVSIIASDFANTGLEAPYISPAVQSVFDDRSQRAVLDVGGDDRGALALGRYTAAIRAEGDYEMLLVINPYRPLTRTVSEIAKIREEIERAGGVPFTGVVNNANLGAATEISHVAETADLVREAVQALGLPLRFTAVRKELLEAARGVIEEEIFPVEPVQKSAWKI